MNCTNFKFFQQIDLVANGEKGTQNKHMVVNTEWGAFGEAGELDFVRTKWDKEVDESSLNPGKQIFEKMISGMYMGELVRLVVEDLIEEGLIFAGLETSNIRIKGSFHTK